ncbi:MAG: hypothetical protein M1831_006166 [Alyxoria varia]|nr:MAG: hypothetical protein M1831_006166 [Alyxoria varia]
MPSTRSCRRPFLILLIGVIICGLAAQLFVYSPSIQSSSVRVTSNTHHLDTSSVAQESPERAATFCPSLPGIDDILVIIKTDATNAHKRLPIHFNTTLSCTQNYKIYSDFAEVVDGHQVHDALDGIDAGIVDTIPEFDYYRRLKEYGREGIRPEDQGQDSPASNLDKWKFLPIVEKAYRAQPSTPWYAFMEADTYLSLPNLLDYTSRMDHHKPQYVGAQMQIGDDVFAYGGAGLIISNTAMRRVVTRRRERLAEYDSFTAGHWAGDCVLGKTLADVGAGLLWAWPNFQGDQPFAIDYGADVFDKHLWCHAAISYHHMEPEEIDATWRFEQSWLKQSGNASMLHASVFEHYILPEVERIAKSADAAQWDNWSDGDTHNVNESGSARIKDQLLQCRSICIKIKDCVQYKVSSGECTISTKPLLGRPAPDGGTQSGWILKRFGALLKKQGSCSKPQWIT